MAEETRELWALGGGLVGVAYVDRESLPFWCVSVPWGTHRVTSVLVGHVYCVSESCTFKLEIPVFLLFLFSMMGAP